MLTPNMEQRLRALADAQQCTVEVLLEKLLDLSSLLFPADPWLRSADTFFELLLIPTCVATLDGVIQRANAAFRQLLGYSHQETVYLTFRDLIHPEDYAATMDALALMPRRQPLTGLVNRLRTKSGETRWLSWTAVQQANDLIYAVVHDVTREKQLEEQLQQQAQALSQQVKQLEAILDSQIDLISLHKPDTTLLFVNDAYCTYFGKTREELIGQSFMQFVPQEEHAAIWQRIEALKQGQADGAMITDNIDRHGQRRAIQWADHVITDEYGQVVMIQSIGRDITRMREMESELASKEREYRLMFESNPLPMWVIEPQTLRFLAVNAASIEKYGYTRDEFLTKTLVDIHPSEDIARLQSLLSGMKINRDRYKDDSWQHLLKDGRVIDVELNVHDTVFEGRSAHLMLIIDITGRKQLERERLKQQKRGLESEKERELQEQRERFFAMVSHEFKTPLAVILSSADLMRRYFDRMTQEQILNRIDIIIAQARETVEMIDEFLAVGPGKQREIQPRHEPVEINTLCRSVIQNVELADDHQHKITLEGEKIVLEADAKMLRQIFNNLLSNAVKYSPKGSTVSVYLTAEGDYVHITVSDKGIGIPEDEQGRIFQPFIRASNASGYKGTGLGLAIVYQNVVAHGGTVDLQSREGEGTRITVHLPRHHPTMPL